MISLVSISASPILGGYAFETGKGHTPILLVKEKPVQNALKWIRENTDENAIIAAHWEYGSWINLLGNRATIVDEQQLVSWTKNMAKKVFIGSSVIDALEFLKSHNADYLFMTVRRSKTLNQMSREAGIHEDFLGVQTFGNVIQETEIKAEMGEIRCFRYCMPDWQFVFVDSDLTLNGKTYSAGEWCISSVYLQIEEAAGSMEIIKVLVELCIENKAIYLAPQHIYYKNRIHCIENTDYLPGSMIICMERNDMNDPEKWHVAYLDSRTQELMVIRVLLLNEMPEIFERVYPPSGTLETSEYRAQVWRIHYPSEVKRR
ncbi:hypothetical protein GF312_22180 [Candidatus Poribacteria bacterium]|nr:hypothetical protein [Candidatus Poribacteria bacterium]